MIRVWLLFAVLMTVFLAVFSGLAIGFGGVQTTHPVLALQGLEEGCKDQPQPCWYGIVPGIMTLDEAGKRLEDLGYTRVLPASYPMKYHSDERAPGCVFLVDDLSTTHQLGTLLLGCMTLKIVEAVGVLGVPEYVANQFPQGDKLVYPHLFLDVYTGLYSQNDRVVGVEFVTDNTLDELIRTTSTFNITAPWHGFVTGNRFCQWEPKFASCNLLVPRYP